MFLRAYQGVPKADEFEEKWADVLKQHKDAANKDLRAYHTANRAGDKKAAFTAGVAALKSCFLSVYLTDRRILGNLEEWADDSRSLKLDKDATKEFKKLHKDYLKALGDGQKAFESINRQARL